MSKNEKLAKHNELLGKVVTLLNELQDSYSNLSVEDRDFVEDMYFEVMPYDDVADTLSSHHDVLSKSLVNEKNSVK